MDFVIAPTIIGLISYFVYMTFELFVRKQERIKMIEKIGQNLTPPDSSSLNFSSLLPPFNKRSFTSLKFGCLLVGIGLGLLAGLFLSLLLKTGLDIGYSSHWEKDTFYNVAYGAPVLLFGGLGLLVSYFIESKTIKKEDKSDKIQQ